MSCKLWAAGEGCANWHNMWIWAEVALPFVCTQLPLCWAWKKPLVLYPGGGGLKRSCTEADPFMRLHQGGEAGKAPRPHLDRWRKMGNSVGFGPKIRAWRCPSLAHFLDIQRFPCKKTPLTWGGGGETAASKPRPGWADVPIPSANGGHQTALVPFLLFQQLLLSQSFNK